MPVQNLSDSAAMPPLLALAAALLSACASGPAPEAEQIVAKVRDGGTPVWYLRAEDEGHGFQKKENQDFQAFATVLFMRATVLK